MKTIYNTYVVMQSQEQCDRMKQLCIDNDLDIWEYHEAFDYTSNSDIFNFPNEVEWFFVHPLEGNEKLIINKTKVTEEEFINLLTQSSE
jgi:hypothetical protein